VAFRRARLEHVYSLPRGKDLASGEVSLEQRNSQFDKLRGAQGRALNLTCWADFLNVVRAAGYRSAKTIGSVNALVFAYQLNLLGRFTSSPESRMAQDLAELRELKTADQFLARLATVESRALSDDYWPKTLPLGLRRCDLKQSLAPRRKQRLALRSSSRGDFDVTGAMLRTRRNDQIARCRFAQLGLALCRSAASAAHPGLSHQMVLEALVMRRPV